MKKTVRNAMLVALFLAAGAVLLTYPELTARVAYAVQSAKADAAAARIQSAQDLSDAFANVAEMIRPSVVSISSVKKVTVHNRLPEIPTPFFDFFDRFGPLLRGPRSRQYMQRGLGTGVIVSEDGYILTNNHVVGGADKVEVQLSDKRTFDAKVVGADPKTDLAVLKIDADNLHPAKLGDSDSLRVGDWVVAAGNPFGLTATITAGIISAKGRANVGVADYEDFIQTDAAINPGNSGGPLVNLRGEVIGINTAIFTRSGGYMGIGFAIPINMARNIMETLIKHGRVVRGWLGVVIQNLTEDLADSFDYDSTEGVLVGDVVEGGPADKAGLKPGDIIVKYDGKKVRDMNQLREMVAETHPDTKVELEIFRDGKYKTVKVRIGELADEGGVAQAAPESLGLTVRTLTSEDAARLNIDEDTRGVVVIEVQPLSPAERAGLRFGDVIVSVQGRKVKDVDDFERLLRRYDLSKGVRLGVVNEMGHRFVLLRADKD